MPSKRGGCPARERERCLALDMQPSLWLSGANTNFSFLQAFNYTLDSAVYQGVKNKLCENPDASTERGKRVRNRFMTPHKHSSEHEVTREASLFEAQ